MPIIKSAKKALRQTQRRTIFKQKRRKIVKKALRVFKKKPSEENLKKSFSEIDKAVKKNIFHQNKASRLKAQLVKLLKEKPSSLKKGTGKKTAQKRTKKK